MGPDGCDYGCPMADPDSAATILDKINTNSNNSNNNKSNPINGKSHQKVFDSRNVSDFSYE